MVKNQDTGPNSAKIIRLLQAEKAPIDESRICLKLGLSAKQAAPLLIRLIRDRLILACDGSTFRLTAAGEAWPKTIRPADAVKPTRISKMETLYVPPPPAHFRPGSELAKKVPSKGF